MGADACLCQLVVGPQSRGGRVAQQLHCKVARPLGPVLGGAALAALPGPPQHGLVHRQPVRPHCNATRACCPLDRNLEWTRSFNFRYVPSHHDARRRCRPTHPESASKTLRCECCSYVSARELTLAQRPHDSGGGQLEFSSGRWPSNFTARIAAGPHLEHLAGRR